MSDEILELPTSLTINAWTGNEVATAQRASGTRKWLLGCAPPQVRTFLKAPAKADPRDWNDERVGWGLVLPHNAALPEEKWSTAADAPTPIQELVDKRKQGGKPAPVLRYRSGTNRIGFLRRDGVDLPLSQSPFGISPGAVPRYLLVYGTPEQIPWEVQYLLNATRAVGRLDLQGAALENYVSALMNDWKNSPADPDSALVWAVDHGAADITRLMRKSIAERVLEDLRADATVGPKTRYLDGSKAGEATREQLRNALAATRPAFVLTTSHGQTGPLDNVAQMTADLGLLVDEARSLVQPDALLDTWTPGGAIWYAHACCSAGSDATTLFDGLVESGSVVDQVLKGITQVGARIAPLPKALLGAAEPIRAFIGHVEPTFDWTLQQKLTKQYVTQPIADALYGHLYQPSPVGLAMGAVFAPLGGLYAEYDQFARRLNEPNMLHRLLVARDIQSTVILGDPTAMLPIQ